MDDFKSLKEDYNQKSSEIKTVRKKLNDLLEFIPFIISGKMFENLVNQINKELDSGISKLNNETINEINLIIQDVIKSDSLDYLDEISSRIKSLNDKKKTNFLLDYSDEDYRKILAVDDNIQNSLKLSYQKIVDEEKNLKFSINKTLKEIKKYEAKNTNPLNQKFRDEKSDIDIQIENLFIKKGELNHSKDDLISKISVINKQISELENKQKLIGDDKKKLDITSKVLAKIEKVSQRIKTEKKHSLERSILMGMNSLMHKTDFIEKVKIELFDDYLDIHLINKHGDMIDKESLSKGEQQLYATSILKSLVEESGISFPIFVDSPLQSLIKIIQKILLKSFIQQSPDKWFYYRYLKKSLLLMSLN